MWLMDTLAIQMERNKRQQQANMCIHVMWSAFHWANTFTQPLIDNCRFKWTSVAICISIHLLLSHFLSYKYSCFTYGCIHAWFHLHIYFIIFQKLTPSATFTGYMQCKRWPEPETRQYHSLLSYFSSKAHSTTALLLY